MNIRKQQGVKTRQLLVNEAVKKFAAEGFHNVRFDTVAIDQGLTTGALYYHFKNKQNLFQAAYHDCAEQIAETVSEIADQQTNIVDGIIQGSVAFIKTSTDKKFRRIVLQDAISVLGWETWKEIDDQTSEKALLEAFVEAEQQGLISESAELKTLTRFISGGINELALWVTTQESIGEAVKGCETTITTIIKSILKEK